MKQIIKSISIGLLVGYFGLGAYLTYKQKDFIYFPTPKLDSTYDAFTLKNEGESINIFVLNKGNANAILYFGGNAESMAQSADYISEQFPKYTIYLMDYRGYGASSGMPSEKGIFSDALKLYDTIRPNHTQVDVGGRSLGSGVATYVASKKEVRKLALITPFDSIVAVGEEMYPIYPVGLILEERYDSKSRAKEVSAETFIVMAENDRVISAQRTQALIEAFSPEQLQVKTIKNRGHADISSDPTYYKTMQDFIGES